MSLPRTSLQIISRRSHFLFVSSSTMNTRLLSPFVLLAATGLLVACLLLRSLLRAALDPQRSLPGPFWSRFSRLWYLSNVWDGHFEKTNIRLHKELGTQLSPLAVFPLMKQGLSSVLHRINTQLITQKQSKQSMDMAPSSSRCDTTDCLWHQSLMSSRRSGIVHQERERFTTFSQT